MTRCARGVGGTGEKIYRKQSVSSDFAAADGAPVKLKPVTFPPIGNLYSSDYYINIYMYMYTLKTCTVFSSKPLRFRFIYFFFVIIIFIVTSCDA